MNKCKFHLPAAPGLGIFFMGAYHKFNFVPAEEETNTAPRSLEGGEGGEQSSASGSLCRHQQNSQSLPARLQL